MLLIEKIGKQIKNNIELMENKNIMFYINPIININELNQELKELKGINFNMVSNVNYYYYILILELSYFQELQTIYKNDCIYNNNELYLINPLHKHLNRQIIRECKKAIRILKQRKL